MKNFSCNCFGNELKNNLSAVIDILNIEIESATTEKIDLILDLKFSLSHTVTNKADFLYISKLNEFSGKLTSLRISKNSVDLDRKLPLNDPGESGYSGFVEALLTLVPDIYVILYMRPHYRFDKNSTFKVLGNSSPLVLDIERNNMDTTPSSIKMSSKLLINNSATPKSNKLNLVNSVRQLTFHTDEKDSPFLTDTQKRFSKRPDDKERYFSLNDGQTTNDAFRKLDLINIVIEENLKEHSASHDKEYFLTLQSSPVSSEANNKFRSLTEFSHSMVRSSPTKIKFERGNSQQLKENLDPIKLLDPSRKINQEFTNLCQLGPRNISSNQSEKALTSIKKATKAQEEYCLASFSKKTSDFSSENPNCNTIEKSAKKEKRRGSVCKPMKKRGVEKLTLGNQPFNQPVISKLSQLESDQNKDNPEKMLLEARKMFPNLIIYSDGGGVI